MRNFELRYQSHSFLLYSLALQVNFLCHFISGLVSLKDLCSGSACMSIILRKSLNLFLSHFREMFTKAFLSLLVHFVHCFWGTFSSSQSKTKPIRYHCVWSIWKWLLWILKYTSWAVSFKSGFEGWFCLFYCMNYNNEKKTKIIFTDVILKCPQICPFLT